MRRLGVAPDDRPRARREARELDARHEGRGRAPPGRSAAARRDEARAGRLRPRGAAGAPRAGRRPRLEHVARPEVRRRPRAPVADGRADERARRRRRRRALGALLRRQPLDVEALSASSPARTGRSSRSSSRAEPGGALRRSDEGRPLGVRARRESLVPLDRGALEDLRLHGPLDVPPGRRASSGR
jgi:hypothetical protein